MLGLQPTAHADLAVHLGEAGESVESPHQTLGRLDLEVVDVPLEAVSRLEVLAEEELAGGQVDANLLPEAASRLGGGVDADVVLGEQLREGGPADAVDHLEQVVVVLRGHQHALAVLGRAPDGHRSGGPVARPHVGVEDVCDGRGGRAPDLAVAHAGAGERGIEGDEPIQRLGPPPGRLIAAADEYAQRRPGELLERIGGKGGGIEHDDHLRAGCGNSQTGALDPLAVGLEALESRPVERGRGGAGVQPGARSEERDPHRFPAATPGPR